MRSLLLYTLIIFVALTACQNGTPSADAQSPDELKKTMEQLKTELMTEKDGIKRVNPDKAIALLQSYEAYVEKADINRTEKVSYLFKAHDVALLLQRTDQALAYLNRVSTEFRDHPKSANALFLQGFLYDSEKKDYDKAAEFYNLFLRRFPDHELVPDALQSMKFLGLSPEEQLQKILEGQQQQ